MGSETYSQYQQILRNDLYSFTQRCFHELNPRAPFLMNWHIMRIVEKLEACRRGKIKRLIINIPPRNLKSLCASVAFPAYLLGHNPAAQVLCVSYGQDLSDKFARDCRNIMSSSFYQDLFNTRLSDDKRSIEEFVTNGGGYRLSTSVGGVVTGRGADFIVIDDPLKPESALSEALRKQLNDWYDNTLYSRLNNKNTGCIIIIMQRLHEDDLVGHVLGQEKWEVVSFPAIAEEDEACTINTVLGDLKILRKAGEALHPERENIERLKHMRATMGNITSRASISNRQSRLAAPWLRRSG